MDLKKGTLIIIVLFTVKISFWNQITVIFKIFIGSGEPIFNLNEKRFNLFISRYYFVVHLIFYYCLYFITIFLEIINLRLVFLLKFLNVTYLHCISNTTSIFGLSSVLHWVTSCCHPSDWWCSNIPFVLLRKNNHESSFSVGCFMSPISQSTVDFGTSCLPGTRDYVSFSQLKREGRWSSKTVTRDIYINRSLVDNIVVGLFTS